MQVPTVLKLFDLSSRVAIVTGGSRGLGLEIAEGLAEGLEEPLALSAGTPASTCTGCHTEQHSDTFQYEAYLRDVLGPGHGGVARQKLGDGPTGHTLRTAALARAKKAGAAQVATTTSGP